MKIIDLDIVVFGGGVAGLWLLDTLVARGDSVLLLEAEALGGGQTVASQGIIHGGLKYTLQGMLTPSARGIREMPGIWRDCLAGNRRPNLSGTRILSEHCHLWRTADLRSRFGHLGASIGLRVKPVKLPRRDWPDALRDCPGDVMRIDEQVIAPASLMESFLREHHSRILKIDFPGGVTFLKGVAGHVEEITLRRPDREQELRLRPRFVVFTAGAGNAALRECVGLSADAMQRRPLHMVMVRGRLPVLHGHCTDAAATRVTVTSARDAEGRTVWQVGGQLAENGVTMDPAPLITHARRELGAVLPAVDFSDVEWATYRVDRAEEATPDGRRPHAAQCRREGNVITGWPTKLALAPQLAENIREMTAEERRTDTPAVASTVGSFRYDTNPATEIAAIGRNADHVAGQSHLDELREWPRPPIMLPPWERSVVWTDGR